MSELPDDPRFDHLRDDAAYKQCSVCGRKSWDEPERESLCWMPQPNGTKCQGVLRAITKTVVDLNQKRLDKALKELGQPLLGGPAPAGAQMVSVLGCSACGSTEFRLGHEDPVTKRERHIVVCAKCCSPIKSLSWYDVNQGPPAA